MELEVRLFIFAGDGSLIPLDKDRFDQAVDRQTPMPEYSGQCLKVAGALIDAGTLQEVFGQFVYIDQEGFVDEEKLNESVRYSDKITEAGYQNEFIWTPGAEDLAKLRKAIA